MALKIVIDVLIDRDRGDVGLDQRVTVSRRLGQRIHRDDTGCATTVVDDELLAESLGELYGVVARHEICATARRHRHDEAYRFVREGLGRGRGHTAQASENDKSNAARQGHVEPPPDAALVGIVLKSAVLV